MSKRKGFKPSPEVIAAFDRLHSMPLASIDQLHRAFAAAIRANQSNYRTTALAELTGQMFENVPKVKKEYPA